MNSGLQACCIVSFKSRDVMTITFTIELAQVNSIVNRVKF